MRTAEEKEKEKKPTPTLQPPIGTREERERGRGGGGGGGGYGDPLQIQELLVHILHHLAQPYRRPARLVCRAWREIILPPRRKHTLALDMHAWLADDATALVRWAVGWIEPTPGKLGEVALMALETGRTDYARDLCERHWADIRSEPLLCALIRRFSSREMDEMQARVVANGFRDGFRYSDCAGQACEAAAAAWPRDRAAEHIDRILERASVSRLGHSEATCMEIAAARRDVDLPIAESLFHHLRLLGFVWDWRAVRAAAASGDLGLLRWMERYKPWRDPQPYNDRLVSAAAAANGRTDVVAYLLGRSAFEGHVGVCMEAAASAGQIETLGWLIDEFGTASAHASLLSAIEGSQFSTADFLLGLGILPTNESIQCALLTYSKYSARQLAADGETMRRMVETMIGAGSVGADRGPGYVLDSLMGNMVARRHDYASFEWMLGVDAFHAAPSVLPEWLTEVHDMRLARFLVCDQRRAPSQYLVIKCASHGRVDLLELFCDAGHESCVRAVARESFEASARSERLPALDWLLQRFPDGFCWPKILTEALGEGRFHVIEWAAARGIVDALDPSAASDLASVSLSATRLVVDRLAADPTFSASRWCEAWSKRANHNREAGSVERAALLWSIRAGICQHALDSDRGACESPDPCEGGAAAAAAAAVAVAATQSITDLVVRLLTTPLGEWSHQEMTLALVRLRSAMGPEDTLHSLIARTEKRLAADDETLAHIAEWGGSGLSESARRRLLAAWEGKGEGLGPSELWVSPRALGFGLRYHLVRAGRVLPHSLRNRLSRTSKTLILIDENERSFFVASTLLDDVLKWMQDHGFVVRMW
jgi:hypothetical protein